MRSWLLVSCSVLVSCGGGSDGGGDAGGRDDAAPRPDGPGAGYANAILDDRPVAYWRFGETSGTTAADASGGGHDGTYFGGTTLGVAGIAGADTAVGLDGTSGCIAIGDVLRFAGRVPFSVEGWVSLTSYGAEGTRMVSSEGSPTGIRSGWSLSASYGDTGYPYFDAWNSDGPENQWTMGAYASVSPDQGRLPLNAWVHVAGTYADDREEIWVNGVLRDGQNQTGIAIPSTQGALAIGCASDGPGSHVYLGIHGAIDEVAIYDRVLTEAEIVGHHQLGSGL